MGMYSIYSGEFRGKFLFMVFPYILYIYILVYSILESKASGRDFKNIAKKQTIYTESGGRHGK